MLADLDRLTVEKAYERWAYFYDALCGPVFRNARRAATSAAKRAGRRILEIGIGTGLSLADYDPHHEVTGIDISEPMIDRARTKVRAGALPHVKALQVMDAQHLRFAEGAFDCVVAQFVITLAADPERVLTESCRVLRPGGELILVNHFHSEGGIAGWLEDALARPARPLGLRPDFRFGRIEAWAEASGTARLIERRKIAPLGLFTLARLRKA
jgi:phosphatidylethanolamine/phosphatidyl-N-methylethanolamine N-methyltransferase